MGLGKHETGDEENPPSEDELAERQRLNNEAENIEMKRVQVQEPKEVRYSPPVVLGSNKPFMKTSHLKYALLTFNCILALLGLIIVILAIWLRADPEFFRYGQGIQIKDFYTVSYLLIIAGIILLLVAFLGCCGVFIESQNILLAYFIIYSIIFIMQLAALILIFSAPYSDKMARVLEGEIKKKVDRRESDQNAAMFMDFVQQNLKCCGGVNQLDYFRQAPRSCLSPENAVAYSRGCSAAMLHYLKTKASVIGGVSVPILLFQLLALLVCYCLLYNIRKESGYAM